MLEGEVLLTPSSLPARGTAIRLWQATTLTFRRLLTLQGEVSGSLRV